MFSSKVIVKTGFLGLMFVPTREVIIMVDVGGFTVIAWTREASRTPHTASAAQHGPTRSCHPLLPLGQKQVSNRLSNLLLLLWITPLGFSILAAKRPERGAAFVVAQPGVCQGDQVGLIEVRMH